MNCTPPPIYFKAKQKALNNGRVYHLAAILRRRGRVIRIGINTHKTHPRFTRTYPDGTVASHMHAEMSVLRFSEPGDTLEVLRVRKSDKQYAMAKPCNYCQAFIKASGISSVRFTNEVGEWEDMELE